MVKILAIGADKPTLEEIQKAARDEHELALARTPKDIDALLKKDEYDIAFIDPVGGNQNARDFSQVQKLSSSNPHCYLVLINSEQYDLSAIIQKNDIFDIIEKPCSREKVSLTINRVLENRRQKHELHFLRGQQDSIYDFQSIIAQTPSFQKVLSILGKFAQTDSTIMITGETGTGKSFLSSSVHYNSLRKEKPFVTINCANLPENILDSELFGHEKGAFTGADKRRIGRLEQANGGTVFLDEVGELNFSLQSKLLRFIEEKAFERVGGNKTIHSDVRIISATNKTPETQVEAGELREDLYYRLNVLRIHIPPLRERTECIEPLAKFLLQKISRNHKKRIQGFARETISLLRSYPWPGNIRQLQNVLERALIFEDSELVTPESLTLMEPNLLKSASSVPDSGESLVDNEKDRILQALERNNWVQKEAARELGISPRVMNYKVKKHHITYAGWKRHTAKNES
ncbi:MAG: sigma-54 dependent transcriptional regulator [Desulfovermiculus sp.]|nr:sigma-54 dependent transcriptional regulator [Desulfovermiculus sp.]